MITGTVLLRPDTNQATANSSNETAAVRHTAETIAGRVNGRITAPMARHSLAPRFQAAASRLGSICARRSRMMAIAKGEQSTTWATMIEWSCPDMPIRDSRASIASPMMTSGMVGGRRASPRYAPFPKKRYRKSV